VVFLGVMPLTHLIPGRGQELVRQLRDVTGSWSVTTEYLNQDGSVSQSVSGSYQFEFVVPDRVLSGYSDVPQKKQRSAILF
jgi:hypothetical protein